MKPFTGVHYHRHGEKPDPAKELEQLAILQVGSRLGILQLQ